MAEHDDVRLVLAKVLDAEHVAAIVDDRVALGCPLTLAEAETIARHCDTCVDPDAAAEALIASSYRGCRVSRPLPAIGRPGRGGHHRGDDGAVVTIVRAAEPAELARAEAVKP